MGKSTYLSNKLLDHVLRGATYSAPAGVYLALFSDMTGVEESGTLTNELSVARKQLTGIPAASGGEITNDATIAFDSAVSVGATAVGFAIMDASTAGNVLYAGSLTTSKDYDAGDFPFFPAGELTISET